MWYCIRTLSHFLYVFFYFYYWLADHHSIFCTSFHYFPWDFVLVLENKYMNLSYARYKIWTPKNHCFSSKRRKKRYIVFLSRIPLNGDFLCLQIRYSSLLLSYFFYTLLSWYLSSELLEDLAKNVVFGLGNLSSLDVVILAMIIL